MLFFKKAQQQLYFFFCAFDVLLFTFQTNYIFKYIVMFAACGPSRFAEEQLALKSSSSP